MIMALIIPRVVICSNKFAVALTLGAMGQAPYRYRVMIVFGVFEFMIPLLGIYLGLAVARNMGLPIPSCPVPSAFNSSTLTSILV